MRRTRHNIANSNLQQALLASTQMQPASKHDDAAAVAAAGCDEDDGGIVGLNETPASKRSKQNHNWGTSLSVECKSPGNVDTRNFNFGVWQTVRQEANLMLFNHVIRVGSKFEEDVYHVFALIHLSLLHHLHPRFEGHQSWTMPPWLAQHILNKYIVVLVYVFIDSCLLCPSLLGCIMFCRIVVCILFTEI